MQHQPIAIKPYTDRVRVRFAHKMRVHHEPEKVFPLLCPVREFDWIPSWDCRIVYTESGLAERGCVFQTGTSGDSVDTWVVSHYKPAERISFVRINPLRTIQYDITLRRESDGSTSLDWQQEITALHEAGDRHVAEQKAEDFAAMIEKVEAMLEHYLETGEPLEAEPQGTGK